jgi:hypothetical protein
MRVYAEYFNEDNVEYRRKTLLQFGDCIDLIGSAVLMNPGGANPLEKIEDISTIERFYKDIHNTEIESKDVWYNFSIDPTMRFLKKIFNGWYLNNECELKGIIQLFNCFYYRDPRPKNAINHYTKNDKYEFMESHLFRDKPVYFGWGNEGKTGGTYHSIAKRIFSEYMETKIINTSIYDSNFDNNCFPHPYYLNTLWNREELKINDDKVKIFIRDFVKAVRKPTE